ncbi:futalosine hydrolase, partial [Streptomyces sp. NPDC048845]|uniref:futalosine hydrolase n=1 Tax=Streptomyces sp. NPDC048845 TaxID=3155390 RepID=UPI00341EE751
MRILVVTAVAAEADAVLGGAGSRRIALPGRPRPGYGLRRQGRLDVLAAGVGPAAAAAGTATALTAADITGRPYGLVVSAGIGGGFAEVAPVGSVVVAESIAAADLGAETPDGFLPVTALGFGTDAHRPPEGLARAVARATGAVYGPVLTVSTVTGTAGHAAALAERHPGAAAEAMEGDLRCAHGAPTVSGGCRKV